MRVVSLGTREISEVTRLKIRSSESGSLKVALSPNSSNRLKLLFQARVGANWQTESIQDQTVHTLQFYLNPYCPKPFLKQQILDSPKLTVFAGDNFKFRENGRKFSKRVQNKRAKMALDRSPDFLRLL